MSVDRQDYQYFMDAGYNASWEGDWSLAIKSYTKAIQIVPEDTEAHIQLGVALQQDGQLDNSLRVYQKAQELAPDDPVPLERIAGALEKMGQLQEAAQQYTNVANVYLTQGDISKAIDNWEQATNLTPGLISVHARLAQAYERTGEKKRAVREYLTLAFNFHRVKQNDRAIKSVERALRIEKRNIDALNMLNALKSGEDIHLPDFEDFETEQNNGTSIEEDFDLFNFNPAEEDNTVQSDIRGPLGESMHDALEMLADHIMGRGLDSASAFASQGMQFQRQEAHEDAVTVYHQAESAIKQPSLYLCLAGELLAAKQPKDAITYFNKALPVDSLAPGVLHGLGQAYYQNKDYTRSTSYLIQSLRSIDVALNLDQADVGELQAVYDSLEMMVRTRTQEDLIAISENLMALLSGEDWKQRVVDARRFFSNKLRSDGDQAIEFWLEKEGGKVAEADALIASFIRQGLYTLAMDEAHRVVETAPYYLAVHVRMAEIMMKEGRVRQALNKYNMVARSYLVREDVKTAASILTEVLEMAPLDISVRLNLIELLEQEEHWDEALHQHIDLANTFQQLGDFEQARETYEASETLAKRISASKDKLVSIKHHLADLAQSRLDNRRAQKIYEEVLEILPGDEKSLETLIQLYLNQGREVEAINRLDKLLGVYAQKRMVNRILQLLEELVDEHPKEPGLRSRLASIYKRMGRKREAIEQLDLLGELQLEAGLHDDACGTLKQIVEMQPEHIEQYQELMRQLSC